MGKYANKLQRVAERRQDPTVIRKVALDSYGSSRFYGVDFSEDDKRLLQKGGDACKYARVSMQEVSQKITATSLADGERVCKQLEKGLGAKVCPVTFRLQGSIPMNVHIRTTHDVDILSIGTRYLMFENLNSLATRQSYTGNQTIDIPSWLLKLRGKCVDVLKPAYPAAKVDDTGAKAIAMSGGSLARKIDVVASCWYDSAKYQDSRNEIDRGIIVLDKTKMTTNENFPFIVRESINAHDKNTNGGAKRIVRLLKSLKEDADEDIALASYDIVSIVCHVYGHEITYRPYFPFSIVDGAASELGQMQQSGRIYTLKTVDNTRLILDTSDKIIGFGRLLNSLTELRDEMAKEISQGILTSMPLARQRLRELQDFSNIY